ncbi:DUF5054 domain-containing protein [Pseudovibrio sp. Tun.PSC04-5.I4]|uniref:DUF5054 domain-containing protein n=1 Tax=Pseudovibrio sp. Tun.PSC04-5.I4 TaxID=1798213 RepID=UPI000888A716|nr:DUF5054 domain-containing protein [Pseudovibrio sp. Tun.PSC04-5.I4]SDQ73678.1 protein of unknown function [Pseudovibrio sp. Tun.PSC04-5.I4]
MSSPTIHLVFKTHLDIGFTDHAEKVRKRYHKYFLPQALDSAEHFYFENPEEPKFRWTTGAWLIWDYLKDASPKDVQRLETGIERGLIRWHGLPFTTHSELMSPALFEAGLSYSRELDERFGVKSIAAKMTDVPGHTLGIVPLMAKAGLKFLHLGVNTASPRPDLPEIFRWRAPTGEEILVLYQNSYGATQFIPGIPDGLSFAHTEDNIGPQNIGQTVNVYRAMEREYPEHKIRAATLDEFAEILWPHRGKFPIITQEIGDSWIHGSATDPIKSSRFRSLQRVYDHFYKEELTPERLAFGRQLSMVAEHTCGVDIKTYLRDEQAWDRTDFEVARATDPRFQYAEASWNEQRAYCDTAVAELCAADQTIAKAAMEDIACPARHTGPFEKTSNLTVGGWHIQIDDATGAVTDLTSPDGKLISGLDGNLLSFSHETYDAADVKTHMDAYLTHHEEWAILDHIKPGLAKAKTAVSAVHAPVFEGSCMCGDQATLSYSMPDDVPGEASTLQLVLEATKAKLQFALRIYGKAANRMPEAGFLRFAPVGAESWELLKTGLWIDADNLPDMSGGQLQAIFAARAKIDHEICITPLDTPLVAPADLPFMPFQHKASSYSKGLRFNIYNNKWGTNFPMWWDGDFQARFELEIAV